jgi:hypothetical protein
MLPNWEGTGPIINLYEKGRYSTTILNVHVITSNSISESLIYYNQQQ